MNGKNTFTQFKVNNLNQPLLYKLRKLNRNINKNFQFYDIRKIDIDYDKHKDLFKYMKELAYLKYRRNHLVKIFKKTYFNILNLKELEYLKRRKSHNNPYHEKTYHRLIYRNFYNYQFKPYVLPLKKEDIINRLNITDKQFKRRKRKKRIFVNPYLDMKIKYLSKVNQRLIMNKNIKNENNTYKKIDYFNLKKSNSVSRLYNKKLNINNPRLKNFKKSDVFPKIKHNNINFNSVENNLYDNDEYDNDDNKSKLKSLDINKRRMLILPKIKDDCLSTINSSIKIEKEIKMFKYGKKETSKKEEEKIPEKNLLNVPPRKLYKLFFGIKKKKPKPKKIDEIKKIQKLDSSLENIQKNMATLLNENSEKTSNNNNS